MGTRWNRLNEAVLTCICDVYFGRKYENGQNIQLKIVVFTAVKYCSIFHGRVIVV